MNILRYKLTGGERSLQVIEGKRKKPLPPPIQADEGREMWRLYRTGRTVPAIRIARRLPEIDNQDVVDELVGQSFQRGYERGTVDGYERGVADGVRLVANRRGPTPQPPSPATIRKLPLAA
jgi:hypothetical protein